MTRDEQLAFILKHQLIAVVRAKTPGRVVELSRTLADSGIPIIEITFTVPNALEVIRQVRDALGDKVLIGAGSVLDAETARAALLAGAEFIVGPTLNLDVIRLCKRYGKLVMPGAFTPTEILTAWEAGADIVKVFPAEIGGPAFFKAVRAPMPQLRLMPTGGVDLTTAASFLKAGACALGLGSALVDAKAVEKGDWLAIAAVARSFVGIVQAHAADAGKRS